MDTITVHDVDGVRAAIDHITELGHCVLPKSFQFATVTIWGSEHRGPDAAVEVRLHIHRDSKAFAAATPLAAICDAERWLQEHNPAAIEATGWAILGVIRA